MSHFPPNVRFHSHRQAQLVGDVPLVRAAITLTNAQIKALPTTPVEIIAAPGEGKVLFTPAATTGPALLVLAMDWTADYTNIDPALVFHLQLGNSGQYAELLSNKSKNFLAWGSDVMWQVAPADVAANGDDVQSASDVVNAPLYLSIDNGGAGDLTGGDAANTMTVTVLYAIVDL